MHRSEKFFLDGIFLLVLIAFSLAFLRLMEPFLLSIFLAVILANIFGGVFRRLRDGTGAPRVASALTTALIVLVVLLPVVIVTSLVTAEIIGATEVIRNNWDSVAVAEYLQSLPELMEGLPVVGQVFEHLPAFDLEGSAREALKGGSEYLLRVSQRSIGNAASAVLNFLVMLFLVYFLLVDSSRIVTPIRKILPLSRNDTDQIVQEMFNTTSATLISTVIIGLMEGALTTFLFLIFRLPSPFLWGVITMVLSMIPLVGTNIVLIPAGLITILTGRPLAGIAIILIGSGGVAITQNVVRPKLVGDKTGLHPAVALLATIGGIAWLGLIGFLVGPVVASLFLVTWRQFGRRYESVLAGKDFDYRKERENDDSGTDGA